MDKFVVRTSCPKNSAQASCSKDNKKEQVIVFVENKKTQYPKKRKGRDPSGSDDEDGPTSSKVTNLGYFLNYNCFNFSRIFELN